MRASATDRHEMPRALVEPTLVAYRSAGIGVFGMVMRFAGMPLEKIALFMNSSQVSGSHQFSQALRLTFKEGYLAPYRVVGPASIVAWLMQYSVMGAAFQTCDHALSTVLGVNPVWYGEQLMLPPEKSSRSIDYHFKASLKTALSPILAAAVESNVSNRAEVQRYFGKQMFPKVEAKLNLSPVARAAGPAFLPNMGRNWIMCQTTFLLTPITYRQFFPQEHKTKTSLFWYGLGMNIFVGNVAAITQQALWGRTLDFAAKNGHINYASIVKEGLQKEGTAAFFTGPKWFSRVLMNAPAQGVLPWFYNEVLPLGESTVLSALKFFVYDPVLKEYQEAKETTKQATSPLSRST
eukprot:CAMPEP_0194048148 /NCGR_PEP_ID=MMETSP0009_2-20130614/26753_1 /TAXON_ID=210454 /ORGANISM="Grammatophora oceanica, Strain CCMP 410" /LENGTH=349 /DNA_ID=CAMNT_0038693963 /DNA_START=263 /DNA_END=1312 /DNA_ORIENTATION=-